MAITTKCKDILKSKIVVIMAIAVFWLCGSLAMQANAKGISNYTFSNVFQYYMLDNQADNITKDNKKQKVASMGNFGSGGASGTFSYDDIVNSVNDSGDKSKAKKFAAMMATYSTFHYVTNQVQGFESTFQGIGRFLVMLLLVPLGVIMDSLHLIIPLFISLIAKFNVITLLGDAYMSSGLGKSTAKNLGISIPALKTLMNAALAFSISLILISIYLTFRKGTVDSRHVGKLKGRLMSLIALGIIVSGGAHLIEEASSLAAKAPVFNTGFSKYLIDDRSWAFNYNFTPSGNDTSQASDIKPNSKSGSYVDLNFNPYQEKGVKRIDAINRDSSLAGNGALFPNSALAYSYGMNESFSAIDFIDYKGTPESENIYGTSKAIGDQQSGSYYQYAQQGAKSGNMLDTDTVYTGTWTKEDGYDKGGPFAAAKDDYIKDKKLLVSPQKAWRDRFIYGAKSAGQNIDKYYNENPSWEQILTQVGASSGGHALTDQSMFLVLSSIFTETGGRYYISAPARGAYGKIASFDSNRSTYSVVSMVGSPMFTIPGLISGPIIQLVVLLMVVAAIESIGLIEMNVKPAAAFFKGLFMGDIEYAYAFIIYSVGVAGTILFLVGIPSILVAGFTTAGSLVQPSLGKDTSATPQASLVLGGMTLIFECLVGISMGLLFLKSKKFREKMTEALVMPWTWAVTYGERLERQVNPYGMQMKSKVQEKIGRNRVLSAMDKANEEGAGIWKTIGGAGKVLAEDMTPAGIKAARQTRDNPDNRKADGSDTKAESFDSLQRQQSLGQVNADLQELDNGQSTGTELSRLAFIRSRLDEFDKAPSKENLIESEKQLSDFRDYLVDSGADPKDIAKVDQAMDNLHGLDDAYGVSGYQPRSKVAVEDADDKAEEVKTDENGNPISNEDEEPVSSAEKTTHEVTAEEIRKQKELDDSDSSDGSEEVDDKPITSEQAVNTKLKGGDTNDEEVNDNDEPELQPVDSNQAVNKEFTASEMKEAASEGTEANQLRSADSKPESGKENGTQTVDSQRQDNGGITATEIKQQRRLHNLTGDVSESIPKSIGATNTASNKSAANSQESVRTDTPTSGSQTINNVQNHNHQHETSSLINNQQTRQVNNQQNSQFNNRTQNMKKTVQGDRSNIMNHETRIQNNRSHINNGGTQTRNINNHQQNSHVDNRRGMHQTMMNTTNYDQRQLRNQRIQHINSLRHAMGPARRDDNVRRAIYSLGNANSKQDFNRSVGELKRAMNHLTPQMRTGINQKNTTQVLHNMVNSIRQ